MNKHLTSLGPAHHVAGGQWRFFHTAMVANRPAQILLLSSIYCQPSDYKRTMLRSSHSSTRTIRSAPALSTLHHVTEKKLDKLARHRQKFEADKLSILRDVTSTNDPKGKVKALIEGFKKCVIKERSASISIRNLELFVRQAEHDPSVSDALLRDWRAKLEHELDVSSAVYDYTALFGNLVIEWIKYPNPLGSVRNRQPEENESDDETSQSSETVERKEETAGRKEETAGRKEMHEQRKEWENYAFVERKVDEAQIQSYLNDIFSNAARKQVGKSPLATIRDELGDVMDFKSDLPTPDRTDGRPRKLPEAPEFRFTEDKLKSCIEGVLKADMFAGKKRQVLVDLKSQREALNELVAVLNMDLESLDEWEWEPSPVPLHMRRHLNGKYRVVMDQEIYQAILLHFIGKIWATAMKRVFTVFVNSAEWQHQPFRPLGKGSQERRNYYLSNPSGPAISFPTSVDSIRKKQYVDKYFMLQLPGDNLEDCGAYNAEDQSDRSQISLAATKQDILRLVTSEMLLHKKIYGEFFAVQSDFKWFGPSFPHSTIFTVLKFFGVPDKWLRFFRKFLETPVVFAHDGPGAATQIRKCGIPISFILSDALSEAVLFCLDFAVNKKTRGANIYRLHDDLWVWGQEKTCVQAWNAIREFSHVMGLNLNDEKTGTALIVGDKNVKRGIPASLPEGKVKWGFLYLDSQAGRWVIDYAQVDEHIEELRRQLAACRSAMAWVQAWNSYVGRFFGANLASPAQCLGPQHNKMVIGAFEHMQKKLFSGSGASNVSDHLRGVLKERFNIKDDIPDGFFYFPLALGGLGLQNPLIDAFATRIPGFINAEDRVEEAFEREEKEYNDLKRRWRKGEIGQKHLNSNDLPKHELSAKSDEDEPFMTLEEFVKYPEETSEYLATAYKELMCSPLEERIQTPPEILDSVKQLGLSDSTYWQWVYNLYGGDIKQRFGGQGLQLGERDLLPLGLVDALKREKVRWEG